jgi:hypothetical protein
MSVEERLISSYPTEAAPVFNNFLTYCINLPITTRILVLSYMTALKYRGILYYALFYAQRSVKKNLIAAGRGHRRPST